MSWLPGYLVTVAVGVAVVIKNDSVDVAYRCGAVFFLAVSRTLIPKLVGVPYQTRLQFSPQP